MTHSGHQEAFEFDRTRLGYQRYDDLPQNPAQNREQFFLRLRLPFWLWPAYFTETHADLVKCVGWDIEPFRLFRALTL